MRDFYCSVSDTTRQTAILPDTHTHSSPPLCCGLAALSCPSRSHEAGLNVQPRCVPLLPATQVGARMPAKALPTALLLWVRQASALDLARRDLGNNHEHVHCVQSVGAGIRLLFRRGYGPPTKQARDLVKNRGSGTEPRSETDCTVVSTTSSAAVFSKHEASPALDLPDPAFRSCCRD